ncbi:MAG TPA: FAD-dependent monooxygenase [Pyrinomonadaceae bacterium]|jgi:geranylgeranyl reductase family protein
MLNYEIIIAGAGPSGSATALQLTNLDPGLASRILLLDKAVFPRPKVCAGGVTADAELILRQLGVDLDLPAAPIHTSKFILPTGSLSVQRPNHIRIFRREEFDYNLFQNARARGVVTQDGEAVENIIRTPHEVIVQTSRNEYQGKILIGADGANSIVRKLLDLRRSERLMMALEIFAPVKQVRLSDLVDNMAVFDFSLTSDGFPGYCWIFPTVPQDPPIFSLGIMEAPVGNTDPIPLKTAFARWLRERGIDLNQFNLKGHPALRYEPRARCSKPRVLLVGDAAGVDPLLGEGITAALALGTIAAQTAFDAMRKGNFLFTDYEERIRSSFIGTLMRRRRLLARRLYTDPTFGRRYLKYAGLLKWVALFDPQRRFGIMTWEPASA